MLESELKAWVKLNSCEDGKLSFLNRMALQDQSKQFPGMHIRLAFLGHSRVVGSQQD
jgi:hypothetical protein